MLRRIFLREIFYHVVAHLIHLVSHNKTRQCTVMNRHICLNFCFNLKCHFQNESCKQVKTKAAYNTVNMITST